MSGRRMRHEALGPKDKKSAKGPAPLAALEQSVTATPKQELVGVHPRVYFTDGGVGCAEDEGAWGR